MTRPLEIDDLYRIPFVEDPNISPDGDRVAFVIRQADREADRDATNLYMVAGPGAPPQQLTFSGRDSSPRWSPDGRSLAFVRGAEGSPPQIWLLPTGGGEARPLTNLPGGAHTPVWSPDGARLAFLAVADLAGWPDDDRERARRAAEPVVVRRLGFKADGAGLIRTARMHIYVQDVDGTEASEVTFGDAAVGRPAWSPDGRRLTFAGTYADDRDLRFASEVFVIDLDGGDVMAITPPDGQAAMPVFTADGERVVFAGSTKVTVGHTSLFVVGMDGPVQPLLTGFDRNVMVGAPAYPGAPPRVTADGTKVVFAARDGGHTHLYEVALAGGPVRKLLGDVSTSISGATLAGTGAIATVAAGPDTCGEVVVIADRQATAWTTLVSDALGDVDVPTRERRVFASSDGTDVEGWVLRHSEGRGPLLLDVHGGPHNTWGACFDAVHLYHYVLAASGWTVLTLNPRGSDGYGSDFYTGLLDRGWGIADLDDFLAPVDALVAEGKADPERLAVTGYSYGGFMTNVLTARTDRFAAAVSGGCVSDLVSMQGTSDLGFAMAVLEHQTLSWEDATRLQAASPLTDVGRVSAPTLLLHGEADDRCPVGQAEAWFTALRARGVETELVRYPGASHLFIALGRPSHRVDYNRRVVDWLVRV